MIQFSSWCAAIVRHALGVAVIASPTFAGVELPRHYGRDLSEATEGAVAVVRTADLNSDGARDIIEAGDDGVLVRFSDGARPPGFTTVSVTGVGSVVDLVVADINGDAFVDIVIASDSGVHWLQNSGGPVPTFLLRSVGGSITDATAVAAADLNDDSHLDLIASDSGRIRWYESGGQATPVFTERVLTDAYGVNALGVADMDEDEDLDIVTGRISWFDNVGDEPVQFQERTIMIDADDVSDLVVVDLDGDFDPDIVVVHAGSANVDWFENETLEGEVFFFMETISVLDGPARAVRVADVTNDFIPDIVAVGVDDAAATYLLNDGKRPAAFFEGSLPLNGRSVATFDVADIDDDGDEDLLIAGDDGGRGWFEQVRVRWSKIEFDTIQEAIEFAGPKVPIVADPGAFALDTVIDFESSTFITLQSTGAILQPVDGLLRLSDGVQLQSFDPGGVVVEGSLEIESGAASISGQRFVLAGGAELTVDPFNDLEIDAPSTIDGDVTVSAFASLILSGQTTFGDRPGFRAGPLAQAALAVNAQDSADMDGDGDLDLIAASTADGQITILENLGGAPLQFIDRLVAEDVPTPIDVAAADLNGDGRTDIIAATNDQIFFWMRSAAEPFIFEPGQGPSGLTGVVAIAVEDVDDDGDDDIITAEMAAGRITLFLSDGRPTPAFAAFEIAGAGEAPGVTDIEVGDIDGDGDPDVLSTDPAASRISWWENLGGATPAFRMRAVDADAIGVTNATLADFNGDGRLDVAADAASGLVWYESDSMSPPGFARRTIDAGGTRRVVAADLDSDGDADLAEVRDNTGAVSWYENDGAAAPTFERVVITRTLDVIGLHPADLDGDLDVDLVASSDAFGLPNWLENRPATIMLEEGAFLDLTGQSIISAARPLNVGASSFIDADTITNAANGRIVGAGNINANLINLGETSPGTEFGPGLLLVNGQYSQSGMDPDTGRMRSGVLSATIGPQSDRLLSTGVMFPAGALIIDLAAGFDPAAGEVRTIIEAPLIIGLFDVAFFPGFNDGRYLRLAVQNSQTPARGGLGASALIVVDQLGQDILFGPDFPFEADGVASDAATADVNGDGFVDLVLVVPDGGSPETVPGSVIVLYNAGVGGDGVWAGFASSAQFPGVLGVAPAAVALVDVDGVNGPDLLAANRVDDTVSVLLNDGAGLFAAASQSPLAVGDAPVDIGVADFDDDGRPDIVVALSSDDQVGVHTNLGGVGAGWAGFSAPDLHDVGVRPIALAIGDFDSTNGPDIAVANEASLNVAFLLNTAGRDFSAPVFEDVGGRPGDIDPGDFDEDKDLDVAVTLGPQGRVSLLLNLETQNGGAFAVAPAVGFDVGDAPASVQGVDFDEDGDRDVAVVTGEDGERLVRILRNDLADGQLAFAPAQDVDAEGDPILVLAADVNNDGDQDLISINETFGLGGRSDDPLRGAGGFEVVVFVNLSPCPGDANDDGEVDMDDLADVLENWGLFGERLNGDLNGDGRVDFVDLNRLLEYFGTSCSD